MTRFARVVLPGYPHHVTQRGNNKIDVFIDDQDRKLMLKLLTQPRGDRSVDVLSFCLMPNHFHALVVPRRLDSLSVYIHAATFKYAKYFNKKYGRCGHLWQNRFFSCPVGDEAYMLAAKTYIEQNPLRAGLVEKIEDWPWSSALANTKAAPSTKNNLPELDRAHLLPGQHVVDTEIEDALRKATRSGKPFGCQSFIREMSIKTGLDLSARPRGRPKKRQSRRYK